MSLGVALVMSLIIIIMLCIRLIRARNIIAAQIDLIRMLSFELDVRMALYSDDEIVGVVREDTKYYG